MEIINSSLITHFYYNNSIDLDPSHPTISSNFFLYTVEYTVIEILAIACVSRMRLFAAYFDIKASRFIKLIQTFCSWCYTHTPTLYFIKLHNLLDTLLSEYCCQ